MKLACYARVVVAVGLSITAAYGAYEPQEVFRDPPTGRKTFTTWKHWTKEDSLLPSGLLGPVTIRVLNKGRKI